MKVGKRAGRGKQLWLQSWFPPPQTVRPALLLQHFAFHLRKLHGLKFCMVVFCHKNGLCCWGDLSRSCIWCFGLTLSCGTAHQEAMCSWHLAPWRLLKESYKKQRKRTVIHNTFPISLCRASCPMSACRVLCAYQPDSLMPARMERKENVWRVKAAGEL